MSTKVSLRWREGTLTEPGFHLYEDCLEVLFGNGEPPVYLQLTGVAVQLETLDAPGASVTLVIPRALARELGLLPAGHPPAAQSVEEFQR